LKRIKAVDAVFPKPTLPQITTSLSSTGGVLVPASRHRRAGRLAWLVASPVDLLCGGLNTTVRDESTLRLEAQGKEEKQIMARPSPYTARVVEALADTRIRLSQMFNLDNHDDAVETETLLLLDSALYLAEQADLARRERNSVEETGCIAPRLLRNRRELERDFRHVLEVAA
jgi:hypothetical protein